MAYLSMPWPNNGLGDAVYSPYSDDEWSDMQSSLNTMSRASSGVIVSDAYPNSLRVQAGAGLTVLVASGEALVDGKFFKSDATSAPLALTAPVSGLNYYLAVLTKDFNAQTVRPALRGPWASVASVAPVQTDGTAWDLPLALVTVPPIGPLIVDDRRLPLASPGSAMVKLGHRLVTTPGATLSFEAIPQLYSSLRLVLHGRASGLADAVAAQMVFNTTVAAGEYGWVREAISAVAATAKTGMAVALAIDIASFPQKGTGASLGGAGSAIVEIPNYRSPFWKGVTGSFIIPNGEDDFSLSQVAGVWRNPDPIEAIYIVFNGDIDTGSHATLYGIL